jgi:alcohol dehydrogenase
MSDSVNPIPVFSYPTRWSHGRGLARRTGEIVRQLGCQNPLVLTGPNCLRLGVAEPVLESLRETGFEYTICDAINKEPTVALFDNIARDLDLAKFDVIVAVGGGSQLDSAKGLALISSFGGSIRDYAGFDKVPGTPRTKVIAIPTTSGTGSEVSDGSVLIDEERKTKFIVIAKEINPTVALTDPLMTVTAPPQVTAFSGSDALVHACESYISKGASPASEMFSLRAIELLTPNVEAAIKDGQNVDVRESMQLGATMAMSAGTNAKLGLAHSAAMPICALYHMPHGQAVGMLLSPVLTYNLSIVGPKINNIFKAMGFGADGFAELDALMTRIGVSARLSDFGYKEEHMSTIVKETLGSTQYPSAPGHPTAEDIEGIIRRMI